MNYLIGTDIGTSGTKSVLMDTKGRILAQALREYDVLTPKPLWAEQWPDIWVDAVKRSIRTAVTQAGVNPEDVAGICISGLYGGSGIPLDEQMKPVRPCLIWMDRRATQEQAWVEKNIGIEQIYEISHSGTDPYYGYTKILWVKHNEPDHWKRIKLFLPPNAYAIYKLTGEVAIDYSSAGNIGGIFDIRRRYWSEELLNKMGIPLSMMPARLAESSEVVGGLTSEASEELGLAPGTPVCAGGVDCVVATLGMGVFDAGHYAVAIGTSMCAAYVHKEPLSGKELIEMPYVKDAKALSYSFGGAATAGALIKWFRDNFAGLEKQNEFAGEKNAYRQLDEEAEKIPAGSEGVLVLPYFMGERSPVWDTDAKGVIYGLSLAHSRAHVYRAFLEAVAYSLRHAIESAGGTVGDTILVAGGVVKSRLWRQIIADVTGKNIVCPQNDVEANLGDVILAGVGTSVLTWDDARQWQVLDEKIMPNPGMRNTYNRCYAKYRSLYHSLQSEFKAGEDTGRSFENNA